MLVQDHPCSAFQDWMLVQAPQPFIKNEPLNDKEMHTKAALAPGLRLGEKITCMPRRVGEVFAR